MARYFTADCKLKSVSPYSAGKKTSDRRGDESPQEHEQRVWKERCHLDDDGCAFIPPMAFANSIKEAAKYANIKIPSQRNATYTKKFASGVMVTEGLSLGVSIDDIKGEWFFVPSDGTPGGGKRVMKCFPYVPVWAGVVTYTIIDPIINQEIFERVLTVSGSLIGIGRFRPANRGYYGRFQCEHMEWTEHEL